MVQQNELIMLLLGTGCMVFILINHRRIQRIPMVNILIAGFYVLLVGYVLTVLEGFFLNEVLNIVEHLCYCVSSILMAVWCWKIFAVKKDAK